MVEVLEAWGSCNIERSGVKAMREFNWDEQVQVKMLNPDHVKWDGISLAEAVRRYMDLPFNERAGLSIFGPEWCLCRERY
jgi:hypothetical protein